MRIALADVVPGFHVLGNFPSVRPICHAAVHRSERADAIHPGRCDATALIELATRFEIQLLLRQPVVV